MPNTLENHFHDHDSKCDHNHDKIPTLQSSNNQIDSDAKNRITFSLDALNNEIIPIEKVDISVHVCLPLQTEWNYYYHLPNDKSWNLESYKTIMSNVSTLEQLIGLNETVTDNIIKNCMLFVMRKGITPMWEDTCNRQGGSFSYKVINKMVVQVWRKLMYMLCGYSLTIDPSHMDFVNGITISPKRGFCIIKIWMKNCTLQDPAIITNIDNLLRNGCLFKAHNPEF